MEKSQQSRSSKLEKYRLWYISQPKSLKIVVIPFFIALNVILLERDVLKDFGWINIVFLFILSLWQLWHQYLDAREVDSINEIAREKEHWKKLSGNLVHLNNIFKQLVINKSEMYRRTLLMTEQSEQSEESQEKAIKFIREANSYKNHLDRIIAMIHKVFEKYADTSKSQTFRVCFLAPDKNDQYLVPKSWYNERLAPPRSFSDSDGRNPFIKDGKTLAGYIWGRDIKFKIIDDVEKHIKESKEDNIFSYLHQDQKHNIKSILCYSIKEPHGNSCIGVICIDSNKEETFEKGESFYRTILESFEERIIYEARNEAMKNKLMKRG